MVNWKDPQVIADNAASFGKVMLVMLGVYGWELLVSLKYDWSVISGKRKFKYPMIFYFTCRYSLLFSLIGINVALNTKSKVDCQSLYVFNQLMGNFAIGTASTLLMLRTIAIWSRNLYIVAPLVFLGLGQWGILLHGVITVRANWVDQVLSCVVIDTLPIFLNLIYIYTMSYDLLVLALSSIGLVRTSGRSDLWTLLFRDGIVYFLVAFSANCVATVFLLLDLNPAMNIIATVPAAVASSIVACRGFVRLSTWNSQEVYLPSHVHSVAPRPGVSVAGTKGSGAAAEAFNAKPGRLGAKPEVGVHISMEAYTTTDNRQSPIGKEDYDDDFSDSDTGASATPGVRYTRSERAQAPEGPRVNFSQPTAKRSESPAPAVALGEKEKF